MTALAVAGVRLRVRWTQFLLAWWYDRPAMKRHKLLLRAEFADGDQLEEARFLTSAGYHVAAACLCRAAIESRLRCAAMTSPFWNKIVDQWRATNVSHRMVVHGFWKKKQQLEFDKLYGRLSKIHHTGRVTATEVREVIERSTLLMKTLDILVLRCLETGGQSCHDDFDATVMEVSSCAAH